MIKRITYKGTINGNFAIACDIAPENMIILEEVEYWQADEGKLFKKGNEYQNILIIGQDRIEEWDEVPDPNYEPEE